MYKEYIFPSPRPIRLEAVDPEALTAKVSKVLDEMATPTGESQLFNIQDLFDNQAAYLEWFNDEIAGSVEGVQPGFMFHTVVDKVVDGRLVYEPQDSGKPHIDGYKNVMTMLSRTAVAPVSLTGFIYVPEVCDSALQFINSTNGQAEIRNAIEEGRLYAEVLDDNYFWMLDANTIHYSRLRTPTDLSLPFMEGAVQGDLTSVSLINLEVSNASNPKLAGAMQRQKAVIAELATGGSLSAAGN